MSKLLAACKTLEDHPFVVDNPDLQLPNSLVDGFSDLARFEMSIVSYHNSRPIDLIIGDDVSGRVPTLITHRFLRLAKAGGHVNYMPQVAFMTSGHSRHEVNGPWQRKLTQHAGYLAGKTTIDRALIITECVATGASVGRIKNALTAHGVEVDYRTAHTPYLFSKDLDRAAVGVEKFPPEPTSRRHPSFDHQRVAGLRYFLRDYTDALYADVYNEHPSKVFSGT